MIYRLRGKPVKKEENRIILDIGGVFYEINIPRTVFTQLNKEETNCVELVIYHYFNLDKTKAIPVLIGFIEDLEREFFEKFITISGIGPKAALRAFDKPISSIAQAIEEGDIAFLKTLAGIGTQRAKQIVAQLQGKVGRFALIKEEVDSKETVVKKEIVEEAKQILKRLQYNTKEVDAMMSKAQESKPKVDTVEELLNEIYRQRR
jgi:Holliday junction DNA helicase RuvA